MKRNKYTKEFETFIRNNVSKYTKEELIQQIQNRYSIAITKEALRRYLNRKHIKDKYTDYKEHNVRKIKQLPIGTERKTNEGTFIKIGHPDIWRRKARVVYEKYHNCKLKDDEYIVFLNQDRDNFAKDNLVKITKHEMACLYNAKAYSTIPELTKLGILSAKLKIKGKEMIK